MRSPDNRLDKALPLVGVAKEDQASQDSFVQPVMRRLGEFVHSACLLVIMAWVGGHRAIFEKKSRFSLYIVLEQSCVSYSQ